MVTRGVVPLVCECCGLCVGVENAAAQAARLAAEEAYFCRACMQLPEAVVVARLTAHSPARCGADTDTGARCGQPAVAVAAPRGYTGCAAQQAVR